MAIFVKTTYSAAQNYSNYAYAYYTRVFCVYAYVYTRTYARIYLRICPFVMHPPKLLYVKHCLTNKGQFWNEKARGFNSKFA